MKSEIRNMLCVAALFLAGAAFCEAQQERIKIGGKGKVSFVNVCDAPTGLLSNQIDRVGSFLMINMEISKGSWSFAEAQKSFEATGASAAIFIVKDKTLPMSLIAMEAKWGVVNAEGLDEAGIAKEALRVATVVIGGASSKYTASTMRPVFKPEDLKTAGEIMTFDSIMAVANYLPSLGIERYQLMTREEAADAGLLKK